MNLNFLKWISLIISLICVLDSCIKSGEADNAKCGDKYTWESDVEPFFIKGDRYSADRINLIYENLLEPIDICADVPVHIVFEVDLNLANYPGAYVTFYGKVYALLTGNLYNIDYDGTAKVYKSSVDLNLKPLFGDQPGSIALQIIADVDSKSNNIDSLKQYIQKIYPKMNITLFYNKVK